MKHWEPILITHTGIHHHDALSLLFRIGLAAAEALGKRGAHVVVSSRRQANVDKAVALLKSQNIQVTGTTCNVGNGEDREKLVKMVSLISIRSI